MGGFVPLSAACLRGPVGDGWHSTSLGRVTSESPPETGPLRVDEELRRWHLQVMIDMGRLHRFLVIGRGKSGTTWLGRILNSHPSVFLRGERKLVEKTAPYTPILRHLLNDRVMGVWGQHTSFRLGLQPERMGPALWRLVDDYLLAASLVSLKVDVASLTHLGDKLALLRGRDVQDILPNLDLAYPGYRAIHIVRDGRDVAVSGFFHVYRNRVVKGGESEGVVKENVEGVLRGEAERLFTDDHLRVRAESWSAVATGIDDRLRAELGDRYLLIRYEDLLADRHAAVERVFSFIGAEHTPALVDEVIEGTSFEKMSGGRSAGDMDLGSGRRKGTAGDWVNYFTARDRSLFAELAQPALERFGYEPDGSWAKG